MQSAFEYRVSMFYAAPLKQGTLDAGKRTIPFIEMWFYQFQGFNQSIKRILNQKHDWIFLHDVIATLDVIAISCWYSKLLRLEYVSCVGGSGSPSRAPYSLASDLIGAVLTIETYAWALLVALFKV